MGNILRNYRPSNPGIPMPFSTLLFDLDDTLVDSLAARITALDCVFSANSISTITAEEFMHKLRGAQFEQALYRLEEQEGRDLDLFGSYRRSYWCNESRHISLYAGVKPVIERLNFLGVKLGVVTQKGWAFQMEGRQVGASQELLTLGMAHLFSTGVGFESVSKHKPHPDGILLALEQLESHASETLVVGDSLADMQAAQAAGCWSCHAIWGIPNTESDLGELTVDMVATIPEDLLELQLNSLI